MNCMKISPIKFIVGGHQNMENVAEESQRQKG